MKLTTRFSKVWMYKTSKKKGDLVITTNKKRNLQYRYLQTITEGNTGFTRKGIWGDLLERLFFKNYRL